MIWPNGVLNCFFFRCVAKGPSKPEIKFITCKDGSVECNWTPKLPGEYKIFVRYEDKEITGSPFKCKSIGFSVKTVVIDDLVLPILPMQVKSPEAKSWPSSSWAKSSAVELLWRMARLMWPTKSWWTPRSRVSLAVYRSKWKVFQSQKSRSKTQTAVC